MNKVLGISLLFGLSSAFHLSGGLSSCNGIPDGLKVGPTIDVFVFEIGGTNGNWKESDGNALTVGKSYYSLRGYSPRYLNDDDFVDNTNVEQGGKKKVFKREKIDGDSYQVEYQVQKDGTPVRRKDIDIEKWLGRRPRDGVDACKIFKHGSFQERYKRDILAVISGEKVEYIYDLYKNPDRVLKKGDKVVVFGTGNAEWDRCSWNYLKSDHGAHNTTELRTWQTETLDFLEGFTLGAEVRNQNWNSFMNFGESFENITAVGERKGNADFFRPFLGSRSPVLSKNSHLLFVRGLQGHDKVQLDEKQLEDFIVLTDKAKCKERVLNNGGMWMGQTNENQAPEEEDKKEEDKKEEGKKGEKDGEDGQKKTK